MGNLMKGVPGVGAASNPPDRSALLKSLAGLDALPTNVGSSYPGNGPPAPVGPDLKTTLASALGGVAGGMQQQEGQGRAAMAQAPPLVPMQLPQFAPEQIGPQITTPYQSRLRKGGKY